MSGMDDQDPGRADTGKAEPYQGFEQGPIRPPSEARSLLLRVSRNCPWNRCTFCPVYKGEKFSLRPADHVKRDIDAVQGHVRALQSAAAAEGRLSREAIARIGRQLEPSQWPAFQAAAHWLLGGGSDSVFLQDANSLAIRPRDLLEILSHIRRCFPEVVRITSYARSSSIVRLRDVELAALRAAGLNRLHIGLESGSDVVLSRVQKGATKKMHIQAGRMVKAAGIELSEYYMPGLGGRELSQEHALESADALNQIDPDFIRLRSLAIPPGSPLYSDAVEGRFIACSDEEIAEEILLFLQNLHGITSYLASDHILNLLQDVCGRLPEDQARMTGTVSAFLALDSDSRVLYQVGRRLGILSGLADLQDEGKRSLADFNRRQLGVTAENCDAVLTELMRRFV